MDFHVDPPGDPVIGDLVVDLPYKGLVIRRLAELQPRVAIDSVTENKHLDLVRLTLAGVQDYARDKGYPGWVTKPIEQVLADLRSWFGSQAGGWVPAMEANGKVYGVIGLPQPKIQGEEEAKLGLADAGRWQHSRDLEAGKDVRVGVLDTGLYAHPDLAGHYRASTSNLFEPMSEPPGEPPSPAAGHATFVAGLIAGQAPAATIIPRRALDDTGHGTVWETAEKMVEFLGENVDVLNVSLGCHTSGGEPCPLPLQRAVEVLSPTTVIVAAAGNHGGMAYEKLPTWPAALPGVLAVGAVQDRLLQPDDAPTPAPFSPQLPWIDCVAPGYALVSTYLNGYVDCRPDPFEGFARWSGTSFAAAMVSGAIATKMIAGQLTAGGALRRLLEEANPVVKKYVWQP